MSLIFIEILFSSKSVFIFSYLLALIIFPEIGCRPIYNEQHKAVFNLSLIKFSSCGVTRIINHITVSSCIYTNFQKLFQENPLHYEEISFEN